MDQVPSQTNRCFYFCGWRQSWGLDREGAASDDGRPGFFVLPLNNWNNWRFNQKKNQAKDFQFFSWHSRKEKKSNNTDCVYFRTKYRLFDYMKLLFRVSERIFTPPNEKSNTTLFLRFRTPFQSVRSTKIFTACKITKITGATMQNMKTAQHSQTWVKIHLQQ